MMDERNNNDDYEEPDWVDDEDSEWPSAADDSLDSLSTIVAEETPEDGGGTDVPPSRADNPVRNRTTSEHHPPEADNAAQDDVTHRFGNDQQAVDLFVSRPSGGCES